MHKSWGNSIDFNEAADEMGVDVMRWLFCNHKPEKDLLFGYHRADEVRRQFLLPLWNVYSFFVTYANIDGWVPDENKPATFSVLDRWVLSRLNQVVEEVTFRLETFEPDKATAVVNRLLDDLSNWYLRRSRRRFWVKAGASKSSDADKHAAYSTLHRVLVTLSRLLAPFIPFVTETMYQNLVRTVDSQALESVHHSDWPTVDLSTMDVDLLEEMALVMHLVSLGHAARNKANRKLRQPLAESAFAVGNAHEREIVYRYANLIGNELNVKEVRLLDAVSEAADFRLHPLPKQLGQKYKERFPMLRKAILDMDVVKTHEAAHLLSAGSSIEVQIEGEHFQILPDEVEVLVEAHEGFSAVAEGVYLAALVTDLTPELELEGLAQEFVRRVQELRKTADLRVDDRINVQFTASEHLVTAVAKHHEYIMGETLALALERVDHPAGEASAKYTFDGEKLEVGLTLVKL